MIPVIMKYPAIPQTINDSIIQSLQMPNGDEKLFFQSIDMIPIPIEVFTPDGMSAFVNRAWLKIINIQDSGKTVGKHNVLNDPLYIIRPENRELLKKAFTGEIVNFVLSFSAQELVSRGIITEKPFESAVMEGFLYPAMNNQKLAYVICILAVKSVYNCKPEIFRAQEYIDAHWKEKFDPRILAEHANISVSQLYNLFNKQVGMTPGAYYRNCKVNHLKEHLADKNLTVKAAFQACGTDSRGVFAKIFKEITGFSPVHFRNNSE